MIFCIISVSWRKRFWSIWSKVMVLKGGVVLPPCGPSGTAAAGVHWYIYLLLNHWCQRIDYAVCILQHNVWFKIIKFGVFTSGSAVLWSSLCLTADSWRAHEQGSEPPVAPDWRRLRWFWAALRSDRVRVTVRTKCTFERAEQWWTDGEHVHKYRTRVPSDILVLYISVYPFARLQYFIWKRAFYSTTYIWHIITFCIKKTWCSTLQPMYPAVYEVFKMGSTLMNYIKMLLLVIVSHKNRITKYSHNVISNEGLCMMSIYLYLWYLKYI